MPTEKSGDRDDFMQQNNIVTILTNHKEKKIHPLHNEINFDEKEVVEESKGEGPNRTAMEDVERKSNQSCQEGRLAC